MDAVLGLAFTATGVLYPFFAAYLGWLGVFLTGSDTASNAIFGSLQRMIQRGVIADMLRGVGVERDIVQLLCRAR